jgi:hypothetical protein
MINRIILTTDILRQPGKEIKDANIGTNIIWIKELIGGILQEISEIKIELFDFNKSVNFSKEFYKAYGFTTLNDKAWVEIFNINEITKEVLNLVKNQFDNSIVIGFELPNILLNLFTKLNIVYLNIIHHPIRYLDDLLHGFSTNNLLLYNKLKKYEINPDLFKLQAIYYRTKSAMRGNCTKLEENSCVIFGQMDIDRSLIKEDGSIAQFQDYEKDLVEIKRKYSHFYFKPHPGNKNSNKIYEYLHTIYPNLSIIKDINTYDLYCVDNVKLLVALSSGTLYEASFFKKNIKYLFKKPFSYSEEFLGEDLSLYNWRDVFVSIYRNYLFFNFWSDILGDLIPVKSKCSIEPFYLNNILRFSLKASWSFNDNRSVYIENQLSSIKNKLAKLEQVYNQIFSRSIYFNLIKIKLNILKKLKTYI